MRVSILVRSVVAASAATFSLGGCDKDPTAPPVNTLNPHIQLFNSSAGLLGTGLVGLAGIVRRKLRS